jgi:hypothetical protein
MGSAPETTLGPHVFGVNYFSNNKDNPYVGILKDSSRKGKDIITHWHTSCGNQLPNKLDTIKNV